MARMIDQIRASKLPSNMMQFAARGALQVPPAENIEILVYLARNNKVFGDLARMTLAGWDEKACRASAADPQTPREVLEYFMSPDNLRPALLSALLENSSVPENLIAKLAVSALRDTIEVMLKSARVLSMKSVVDTLRTNPYVRKQEVAELLSGQAPNLIAAPATPAATTPPVESAPQAAPAESAVPAPTAPASEPAPEAADASDASDVAESADGAGGDEAVHAYVKEHEKEIAAEGEKPFQPIGALELLGQDYFPKTQEGDATEPAAPAAAEPADAATAAAPAKPALPKKPPEPKRENTMQKINRLDVKGRIQLALKGNKEERSILIRDGTKVVALAVLEAPKLSDGEVEKFASQKNVLEAVLRQIPLKRRFVKNYIVVRNLVANPRTPIDLGLGLMKNLLVADLKNLAANKEISETIRKLATKMFKQKMDAANKK